MKCPNCGRNSWRYLPTGLRCMLCGCDVIAVDRMKLAGVLMDLGRRIIELERHTGMTVSPQPGVEGLVADTDGPRDVA